MDDKELEKTKPIEIISDVSESRFSKYNDEKQEEVSRVEKHKEVLEEEQNRIDEEAAEEALAEKNIALAESYLAEEKQEVLEEPEPQKKMKLIDKIKAKWDDMDKKQRIMLIVVLALVLILIVIFTIFIVIKLNKKDTLDKPEKKVEEKAPEITDNFYYKDGKLYFLDASEKEIGTYECENKDSKLCYVVNNDYRDNFDVPKLEDEDKEEIVNRMSIYEDNYVFVVDTSEEKNKDTKLYSIKDNEVKGTYSDVKAYDDNYVIVANADKKYGLIEINDGIKEVINNNYEYLGLIDGEDNLIAKNKKGYVVIDKKNKELSSVFDSKYEIKSYNNNFVVAKVGSEYLAFNYKNELIASGYKYITVADNYVVAVNDDKKVYIYDAEKNKYNEGNITLNNDNYVKTYIYNDKGSILEIKRSFEVTVKDTVIEIAVYKEGEDNPTYKNIDIVEGLANKKNKYVNYFENKLYIYKDLDKTQLLTIYTCDNKNYITKESDTFDYCFIAKDEIYEDHDMVEQGYKDRKALVPIINNKFIFIKDGNNTVKLYNFVEDKVMGTYTSVNSYTNNNDYNVSYFDGKINIVGVNKKGKYGVLTIDGETVSARYTFDYNKIEKMGDNFIAQDSNNNWKLLKNDGNESESFKGKIMGYSKDMKYFKIKVGNNYVVYNDNNEQVSIDIHSYVDLYNDYYVGIDKDKNLYIYDYQGEKLYTEGIKLGDYPYINTNNPAYKVKKVGNDFVVSVYDGSKYIDHSTKNDVRPPEEEEPTE